MSTLYSCPHCRSRNFATRSRLQKAAAVPVKCWKCGKPIPTSPAGKRKQARKRAW